MDCTVHAVAKSRTRLSNFHRSKSLPPEETRGTLIQEPFQLSPLPRTKKAGSPPPTADNPDVHSPCHPPSSLQNLLRRRSTASLLANAAAIFTEGTGTSGAFQEKVEALS